MAEGNKQAAILSAEGARQAAILNAEGGRQAAILNAEGYSMALTRVFEAAQGVDAKTMSLQYLDTLKQVGQSPSTKWLIPIELSSLLSNVMGQAGRAFAGGGSAAAIDVVTPPSDPPAPSANEPPPTPPG